MDFTLFLRGIILGISIAAPVGPMSILCMRRILAQGRGAGFATGLGISCADGVYAIIGGFGLTAASSLLNSYAFWLRLIGGGFLCYLGIKIFLASPAKEAAAGLTRGAYFRLYISAFLLTLTNPATIFSFAAILAGIGLGTGADYGATTLVVVGIFSGSVLWMLTLTMGVSLFRNYLTPKILKWINRISGLIILSFGLLALISIFSLS